MAAMSGAVHLEVGPGGSLDAYHQVVGDAAPGDLTPPSDAGQGQTLITIDVEATSYLSPVWLGAYRAAFPTAYNGLVHWPDGQFRSLVAWLPHDARSLLLANGGHEPDGGVLIDRFDVLEAPAAWPLVWLALTAPAELCRRMATLRLALRANLPCGPELLGLLGEVSVLADEHGVEFAVAATLVDPDRFDPSRFAAVLAAVAG